ncbi:MAG: hypothetical protein LAO07_05390 [Acidobacteriia bacterium]|nr:hypothetical protein [Terriglobia bacterium]
MIYVVAEYLHVLSVLGLTAAMTIELHVSRQIQSSSGKHELLVALREQRLVQRIGLPSYLTILITGFYMAAVTAGDGSWWIAVSLGAFLLMAVIGGLLTGRAFFRGQRILNSDTAASFAEAKATLGGKAVKASWRIRVLLLVTILALMIFQPSPAMSIAVVLAGVALALLSRLTPRRHAPERS